MNPLDFITGGNVSRLVVTLLIGLAAGSAGTWRVEEWRWSANTLKKENAQLAQQKEAERENRNIESARSLNVQQAISGALQRAAAGKADAVAARGDADGLRNDLAQAQRDLSSSSAASCRKHSATLNTVFAECTSSVEGLAGKAQGHASDALTVLDAWPKK